MTALATVSTIISTPSDHSQNSGASLVSVLNLLFPGCPSWAGAEMYTSVTKSQANFGKQSGTTYLNNNLVILLLGTQSNSPSSS